MSLCWAATSTLRVALKQSALFESSMVRVSLGDEGASHSAHEYKRFYWMSLVVWVRAMAPHATKERFDTGELEKDRHPIA